MPRYGRVSSMCACDRVVRGVVVMSLGLDMPIRYVRLPRTSRVVNDEVRMPTRNNSPSRKPIWTYGYQIVPPQPEGRLATIPPLLDQQHTGAKRTGRTWAGRMVLEQLVTHILVVTDDPALTDSINRQLGAELERLDVKFQLTVPMAVAAPGGDGLPPADDPGPP